MTKTMVSFRLDDDTLEYVDRRANNLGITRTEWFQRMTEFVLANTFTTNDGGPAITEEYRRRAEQTPAR